MRHYTFILFFRNVHTHSCTLTYISTDTRRYLYCFFQWGGNCYNCLDMVDEHAFMECVFMQVYNALSGMKISSLDKPVQVREKARSIGIVKEKLLYSFIHFVIPNPYNFVLPVEDKGRQFSSINRNLKKPKHIIKVFNMNCSLYSKSSESVYFSEKRWKWIYSIIWLQTMSKSDGTILRYF